jgi:hypothetical protein
MAAAGTAEWAAAAAEGAAIAVLEGDHKGRAGIIYDTTPHHTRLGRSDEDKRRQVTTRGDVVCAGES